MDGFVPRLVSKVTHCRPTYAIGLPWQVWSSEKAGLRNSEVPESHYGWSATRGRVNVAPSSLRADISTVTVARVASKLKQVVGWSREQRSHADLSLLQAG